MWVPPMLPHSAAHNGAWVPPIRRRLLRTRLGTQSSGCEADRKVGWTHPPERLAGWDRMGGPGSPTGFGAQQEGCRRGSSSARTEPPSPNGSTSGVNPGPGHRSINLRNACSWHKDCVRKPNARQVSALWARHRRFFDGPNRGVAIHTQPVPSQTSPGSTQ